MGKPMSQSPSPGSQFHRNAAFTDTCPCKVEGNFIRCSPGEECIMDNEIPNRMGNVVRCDCYESDNLLVRLQAGRDRAQANSIEGESSSHSDEEDLTGRAMEIISVVDDLLEQAAALKKRLILMVTHFQAKACRCSEQHCRCGVALNDRGHCKCPCTEEPLQTTVYDANWNTHSFSNKALEEKSIKSISVPRSDPQNTVYQNISTARTRGGSIFDDGQSQDLPSKQTLVSNGIKNTNFHVETLASQYSKNVKSHSSEAMSRFVHAVDMNESHQQQKIVDSQDENENERRSRSSRHQATPEKASVSPIPSSKPSHQQQKIMDNREEDEDERRSRSGRHQTTPEKASVSPIPSSKPSFHVSNISSKLLSIQQEIETLRHEVGRLSHDTVLCTHTKECPCMLEEIMSSNLIGKADEIKETLAEIKSDFCQKLSESGGKLFTVGEKRIKEKVEREIRRTHPDYSRTINQIKLTKGDKILEKNLQRTVFDQTYETNIDTLQNGGSKAKNVTLTVEKRTDETIRNPLADDEYRHVLKQSNKLIKTDDRSIKEEDAFQEEEVKRDEKRLIETRRRVTRTEQLAGKEPKEEIIVNVKINRTIDEKTGQVFETRQELGNEPFTQYPEETLKRADQLTEQHRNILSGSTKGVESKQNDLFRNNYESRLQSGIRSKAGSIANSARSVTKSKHVPNVASKAASYFEAVAEGNAYNEPHSRAFMYPQQEQEEALSNECLVQSCKYENEQDKFDYRENEYGEMSKFEYEKQDGSMARTLHDIEQDYRYDVPTPRIEQRSSMGDKKHDYVGMQNESHYDRSQRTDEVRKKFKQCVEESSQTECTSNASRKSYTTLEQPEGQFCYKFGSQLRILTESELDRICANRAKKRGEPKTSKANFHNRISAGADYLGNRRANFDRREKNHTTERHTRNFSTTPGNIESQKQTLFFKPQSQSNLIRDSNFNKVAEKHIDPAGEKQVREEIHLNPQRNFPSDKFKPPFEETSSQRWSELPKEKNLQSPLASDKSFRFTRRSKPTTSSAITTATKGNRIAGGASYFRKENNTTRVKETRNPSNQHGIFLGRSLHKPPREDDQNFRSTPERNHRVSSSSRPELIGQTSRRQYGKSSENGHRISAGENTTSPAINPTESGRFLNVSAEPYSSQNSLSLAAPQIFTKDSHGKGSQQIQSPTRQHFTRPVRQSMQHTSRPTVRSPTDASSDTETSLPSIDLESISNVIEDLSGGRPPTDFFVSVLPEQMQTKTFRINVIDKETGNLLGYFYVNEEKFHLARTRGVFSNYLTLYVLNSIGSITDFKSGINPKSLNRYQCFAKNACSEK